MAKKLFTLFGRAGNIKGKWRGVFPALLGIVWLMAVLAGCATSSGTSFTGRQPFFDDIHTRTVYAPGQDFDIKDDSDQYEYKMPAMYYAKVSWTITVNGYNKHQPGEQLVTITLIESRALYESLSDRSMAWSDQSPYKNPISKTREFRVTVVPVDRITVQQLPDRMTYTQGQDFNPAGLLVRVEYEGGAIPEETIGPDRDRLTLSGYNKNRTGVQTITVDYYGKQTSLDVMVRPN